MRTKEVKCGCGHGRKRQKVKVTPDQAWEPVAGSAAAPRQRSEIERPPPHEKESAPAERSAAGTMDAEFAVPIKKQHHTRVRFEEHEFGGTAGVSAAEGATGAPSAVPECQQKEKKPREKPGRKQCVPVPSAGEETPSSGSKQQQAAALCGNIAEARGGKLEVGSHQRREAEGAEKAATRATSYVMAHHPEWFASASRQGSRRPRSLGK